MTETDEVSIKKTLTVFELITSLGQKDNNGYHYNSLTVFSDHDGYNVTIKNDYADLTIFFHNKFSFNYSSKKEKLLFLEKIDDIYKNRKK